MKIDKILHNTLSLLAGGLLTVSLTGCLDDNSACIEDQPGYQEGNDVWLSFHVKNMGEVAKTRAEAPNDPIHPDEDASIDENFINTSDMALMFFDDRQILWKSFLPGEYVIEEINGTNGSEYTLKFKMNKDYFSYAKGKENVEYSLMVVANINGLKGEASVFDENLFAYSPQRIASLYKSFAIPDQSVDVWMPSKDNKDLIPMAGIIKGSFSSDILEKGNTWETAAEIGDVYMQRCLAKIRILDAIPLQDDSQLENGGTAKIESVKLIGSNTKGAYIPSNAIWYNGTSVVESATEQVAWFDNQAMVNFLNTGNPHTSIVDNVTYPNQFYCYVTESVVSGRDTKLQIAIDFGYETKTFEIPLATSYGSTYKGIDNISRNHIYEYIVNATMASVELQLHVNDWEEHETNWNYKDNPTVAEGGYLVWQPSTESSNVILSSGGIATGTFRFSDPVGGFWYASLIPEGQTEAEAFKFINESNEYVDQISGKIGETVSTVKIRAMLDAGVNQRSARLVFTVKTPDGRTLTADLVDGDDTYYTIVQNAKL